jgi:hypothetical protein
VFRRQPRPEAHPTITDARQSIIDKLEPWKLAQSRAAWRPIVTPGEPGDSVSKFCGAPWLMPDELVPNCTLCGRDLQLLVQLDLGAVPSETVGDFGAGVVQLFYCVGQQRGVPNDGKPECWAEGAWEPFSNVASRVRVVPRRALAPTPHPGGAPEFAATAITGWERFEDFPHPVDHEAAGLLRLYDFEARTVTLRCPSVGLDATIGIDDLQVEDIAMAAEKDKLNGWPCWVQGNEQPACPTCGTAMTVLFQVDSDDHVPYMFGDMGIGHITQCPTHPDTVAFGWACS